jgi:hypothetical protein
MCDPAFVRECAVGQRGVTWDYNNNGEPQMNEYGKAQMDAFLTGDRSSDNYFTGGAAPIRCQTTGPYWKKIPSILMGGRWIFTP